MADTRCASAPGRRLRRRRRTSRTSRVGCTISNVSAEYQLRENIAVRLSYLLEDLKTGDWAIDGVAPNTIANVLGLGEDSPHYRNHLVGFAVRYEFR